ncbi:MAG TPA: matrixin family metalloprotease [Candidatus Nanopelagicales bacterium]
MSGHFRSSDEPDRDARAYDAPPLWSWTAPVWHGHPAAATAPPRAWEPAPRRSSARREWTKLGVALVLIVALAVIVVPGAGSRWPLAATSPALTLAAPAHDRVTPTAPAAPTPSSPENDGPYPTPGYQEASHRLLPARPSTGSRTYTFEDFQPGTKTPISYDPCRPIHFVVNPVGEPDGGTGLIRDAVAKVQAATGLKFVYDGTSSELFLTDRPDYQPERYGDRWAPVLFTWSTDQEDPALRGDVIGDSGSDSFGGGGDPYVYVTGTVDLDAGDLSQMLDEPNGYATVRSVVMHELGHVVGLNHVHDPHQLMYPESTDVTEYGAGDRAGLARLGEGPCAPWL